MDPGHRARDAASRAPATAGDCSERLQAGVATVGGDGWHRHCPHVLGERCPAAVAERLSERESLATALLPGIDALCGAVAGGDVLSPAFPGAVLDPPALPGAVLDPQAVALPVSVAGVGTVSVIVTDLRIGCPRSSPPRLRGPR
jgi:hypothetical protein